MRGKARVVVRVLVAVVALAAAACSAGFGATAADGSEGGACYGNGTCNAGLTCASNLCVSIDAGGIVDAGPKASDAPIAHDSTSTATPVDASSADVVDASMTTCARLQPGAYTATTTSMQAADYDGGACENGSSNFTVSPDGGGGVPQGCMISANGCVITCDFVQNNGNSTTTIHETLILSADGTGYTGSISDRVVSNNSGNVIVDCLDNITATMQ
jgi:hypothetical protein